MEAEIAVTRLEDEGTTSQEHMQPPKAEKGEESNLHLRASRRNQNSEVI